MKKFILLTCLIVAALGAAACTPTEAVHGNMLQDYQMTDIKPGVDTQSDVLRKLGSPTTKAPFNDNVWYYIGQQTQKKGILDPKVEKERVVVVTFNDQGLLSTIQDVDNKRMDIPYVRDKTATSGHEITFLQQLLGNMGRFNKDSMGQGGGDPGGGN